jgi:ABC-type microcin C transport system permease subunit YejB
VTILWNDVEILAKWGMLKEPWVHINWPIMSVIIGGFAVSTYLIVNDLRKRKMERIEAKDIV